MMTKINQLPSSYLFCLLLAVVCSVTHGQGSRWRDWRYCYIGEDDTVTLELDETTLTYSPVPSMDRNLRSVEQGTTSLFNAFGKVLDALLMEDNDVYDIYDNNVDMESRDESMTEESYDDAEIDGMNLFDFSSSQPAMPLKIEETEELSSDGAGVQTKVRYSPRELNLLNYDNLPSTIEVRTCACRAPLEYPGTTFFCRTQFDFCYVPRFRGRYSGSDNPRSGVQLSKYDLDDKIFGNVTAPERDRFWSSMAAPTCLNESFQLNATRRIWPIALIWVILVATCLICTTHGHLAILCCIGKIFPCFFNQAIAEYLLRHRPEKAYEMIRRWIHIQNRETLRRVREMEREEERRRQRVEAANEQHQQNTTNNNSSNNNNTEQTNENGNNENGEANANGNEQQGEGENAPAPRRRRRKKRNTRKVPYELRTKTYRRFTAEEKLFRDIIPEGEGEDDWDSSSSDDDDENEPSWDSRKASSIRSVSRRVRSNSIRSHSSRGRSDSVRSVRSGNGRSRRARSDSVRSATGGIADSVRSFFGGASMSFRPTDDPTNVDPTEDDTCDQCSICFIDLQDGDRVGDLPCNHLFHVDCLKGWIKRRNVCPLCLHADIATPQKPKEDDDLKKTENSDETGSTEEQQVVGNAPQSDQQSSEQNQNDSVAPSSNTESPVSRSV